VSDFLPKGYAQKQGYEKTMSDAKEAINKGASKVAVRKRLRSMGYSEQQLNSPYFNWLK